MFKKIGIALLAFLLATPVLAGGIPQIPSSPTYSEPSQIVPTLNAFINQLNGNALGVGGYAAQPNNAVSLGSLCQPAAGGSPLTCNGQRMIAAFTGITVGVTDTLQTLTITNSSITTASACNANWNTAFTAGSALMVSTIVPSAGSLAILVTNTAATTNVVTTGTLAVNCFN